MGLLIFLPIFVNLILCGLFFQMMSKRFVQVLTVGGVLLSFFGAISVFLRVLSGKIIEKTLLEWIKIPSIASFGGVYPDAGFTAYWSFYADSLSAIMFIVVTGVSLLVHLYSLGYMSHDPHQKRFMIYLNLFTFFMLVLVSANNFLQLFVGWEGVGVSSYLLIGFWFNKNSANAASIKAFVVNRVGDLALIIGICLIYFYFGTLEFKPVFAKVGELASVKFNLFGTDILLMNLICTCLFLGAMGKSAQLGLHVWLPDAMEGPTPVSALIHAATMVTAGVFLLARCSFLFEYAPFAKNLVVLVGALTAIFAATIALTQNDIKKIIAYSTCSQLGYMFFAAGLGAYEAAIFHLATHAFFKALLFLSAGSVIHAIHEEQDISKMGGLAKKIPLTYTCFLIGSLAIAGIFPFAGYFSKDAILEAAFMSHSTLGNLAFALGILAASLTSFYSWRLIIKVFNGKTRLDIKSFDEAHECPPVMAVPLLVLLCMSVITGFVGVRFLNILSTEGFFHGVIYHSTSILDEIHYTPTLIKYIPMVISIFMIILAYFLYLIKPNLQLLIKSKLSVIYYLFYKKYYVDEAYKYLFVKPVISLSLLVSRWLDRAFIDRFIPHLSVSFTKLSSYGIRKSQSGMVQNYVILSLTAFIIIIYFTLGYVK